MPRRLRVSRLQALTMTAASGAYAMAGYTADLVFARRLTMQCTRGIYQISGYNVNLSKQTYISGDITDVAAITANVTLPTGVAITSTPSWRITASSSATIGTTNSVNLTIVEAAAGDWATRISGPGVVWYHSFDNAAEVNQFRWSGQQTQSSWGGNDPNSVEVGSQYVTHQTSGGADGGGYMRIHYPLGSATGRGNSSWWRPFNPLTGATNGRGSSDPGANGTLTPVAWNVSSGSSTLLTWSSTATNPGFYGHATEAAAFPTKFQGNDYYVQFRVRRAIAPGPPPDNPPSFTNITGKSFWLTTTVTSNPSQELVTYGASVGNGDVVGVQPRHNVYVGQNFGNIVGQPNVSVATSNWDLNWRYTGGWDTLLYHITPGTHNGTGTNRTRVEVWAQRDLTLFPAESGQYTKIWDVTYTQGYTSGSNSSGAPSYNGWNAMLLSAYHNGSAFTTTAFNQEYDQVIFSKATIPAPTV
jgi:hypothetical protein